VDAKNNPFTYFRPRFTRMPEACKPLARFTRRHFGWPFSVNPPDALLYIRHGNALARDGMWRRAHKKRDE